jgi:hypothetical protein
MLKKHLDWRKILSIPVKKLKIANRNVFIEELLNVEDTVEDVIYTDVQKERLAELRKEREYDQGLTTEEQNRMDRDNSFKMGDRITFEGNPGIITFVGGINKKGVRKYTIKLQDDREHRFVLGKKLEVRKVRERILRDDIPSDDLELFDHNVDRFEKMTTPRIIKWKNARNWNYVTIYSDMSIEKRAMLYVLQDREHHTRKKPIVVNYDKNA